MANRSYKAGTRAALIMFSTGTCYWPGCKEALLRYIDGEYIIALDIAHIRALDPGGARYDPSMSDTERNDFPNLVYLCRPHHKVVDGKPSSYPVDLLLEWKRSNETEEQSRLRATSGPITQEMLAQAISSAMTDRDAEIKSTLTRLEQSDGEAARLVRDLLEEVRALRSQGSPVDEDTAMMLSDAARDLRGLEDSATLLSSAARDLVGLEDIAVSLNNAAENIRRSGGFM